MSGTVVSAKRSIPRKAERRKQKREIVYTRFVVQVQTKEAREAGEAPLSALLTDISTQGLGLISDRRLDKKTNLIIILHSGTNKEHQIIATAEWSRPLPSAGKVLKGSSNAETKPEYWRVGLSLDSSDTEQLEYLSELIKSL